MTDPAKTKERPILFTPAMAAAVHAGTKTQTRRVVKKQHDIQFVGAAGDDRNDPRNYGWLGADDEVCTLVDGGEGEPFLRCPYGVPGDRLYVREGLRRDERHSPWTYAADGSVVVMQSERTKALAYIKSPRNVIPNIHMPRWACRSVLEVVSVRVDRVESITEADAIAEGFTGCPSAIRGAWMLNPQQHFLDTFYRINKRAAEGSNPFVWVVEFRRITAPMHKAGVSNQER